jgi:hypothetical protein
MRAANRKAIGVGLPKPTGGHILLSLAVDAGTELQNLTFALLGFDLGLTQFFLVILLFLPFKNVFLCNCILEVCNLLFFRGSQIRVCIESQRRLEFGLLSNVGVLS